MSVDDELAELLGAAPKARQPFNALPPLTREIERHPTTPKKASLPSETEAELRPIPTEWLGDDYDPDDADAQLVLNGGLPDPSAFLRPVGVTFLAVVFRTEPRRIYKKLIKCPIVGRGTIGRGKGAPLYDFATACSYLVEPRIDLKEWFRSLSTTTMPPIIAKAFWDAMRVKNKAMEESGHYWHDDDVLRVLGDVFMGIKDTTLLWIEELPNKATLSTEDYHALRRLVNELVKDVQEKLVDMPRQRVTESVVASIERDVSAGVLDRLHGGDGE